MKLNLLTNTIY